MERRGGGRVGDGGKIETKGRRWRGSRDGENVGREEKDNREMGDTDREKEGGKDGEIEGKRERNAMERRKEGR